MKEQQQTSLLVWLKAFFMSLLGRKHSIIKPEGDPKNTPEYWPEVREYLDTLQELIKTHTKNDDNVQQVNEWIVRYIVKQINTKGSIENITERYLQLDTLADRILTTELNKIAGLEPNLKRPEFSDATRAFKESLSARKNQELKENRLNMN